jgi:peptide-methionine (S)-S-oxide reductase
MSRITPIVLALVAGASLFAFMGAGTAAEMKVPAAAMPEQVVGHSETAVFAGGCFWGVEGVFSHVKGVISATSGYAGGTAATADYETVSSGTTGHAESVRVVFDPTQVNYAELLRIYFSVVADPTQVNRQGPDSGTQYRSALFPVSATQGLVARAYIAQLTSAHVFARPIATRIEMNKAFYPAEAHHQDFMARNPNYPYIIVNDRPKVEGLRRLFPANWRG